MAAIGGNSHHSSENSHPVNNPPKIFISYAHEDADWLAELKKHLRPMIRSSRIDVWDDTRIRPGADWDKDIKAAIEAADLTVLLVTPEFLDSDYIVEHELPHLLKKRVVWVAVQHSLYRLTEIGRLQAAHPPDSPLASLTMSERTKAWVQICEQIEQELAAESITALNITNQKPGPIQPIPPVQDNATAIVAFTTRHI